VRRYISEEFAGAALHPVDLYDAGTGRLLQQLVDPNFTHISPVNKPHPRLDVIISGASRSLYAWRPAPVADEEEAAARQSNGSSSSSASGGTPFKLQGSTTYMYFDADPVDDTKKKRKAAASTSAAVAEESDGDEPGPSKATKGRKKK